MALLSGIFSTDPYEEFPIHFATNGMFPAKTACGYKITYKLVCHYQKVDHKKFKSTKMLEDDSQRRFLDAINREIVIPALKRKGRSLRFCEGRYSSPKLLCGVRVNGKAWIAHDHNCAELNKDLKIGKFEDSGCAVTFLDVQLPSQPDEIIDENYKRMITLYDDASLKNTREYAAHEEALLVAAAKRELDLRNEFRQHQTERFYKGEKVSITTRLAGRALEIAWKFENPLSRNASLRGYRKDGGFPSAVLPLEGNGACIADSRVDDKTVLTLAAGTDHFFTFVITETGTDGLRLCESLRFSARLPTVEELSHVERLLLTIQANEQKSTMSKKTSDAVQELMSFVEFEEVISGVEKQLIERISNKGYSPAEKAEKIDRLKSVVESLRAANS